LIRSLRRAACTSGDPVSLAWIRYPETTSVFWALLKLTD
jgi:hypothetical protein